MARCCEGIIPFRYACRIGVDAAPDYIAADHSKMTATFVRVPAFSDVPYPVVMEPNLVVGFYSR